MAPVLDFFSELELEVSLVAVGVPVLANPPIIVEGEVCIPVLGSEVWVVSCAGVLGSEVWVVLEGGCALESGGSTETKQVST